MALFEVDPEIKTRERQSNRLGVSSSSVHEIQQENEKMRKRREERKLTGFNEK